jgi:hypothetical protein
MMIQLTNKKIKYKNLNPFDLMVLKEISSLSHGSCVSPSRVLNKGCWDKITLIKILNKLQRCGYIEKI